MLKAGLFRTNRHLSYLRLRTPIPPAPAEVAAFEAIMRQMRLSTGVYRTTFRGRFQALDEFVATLMTRRFAAGTPLEVHDWAASDCLTSAEWAPRLFESYPGARLQASDLTLWLVEAQLNKGGTFILEESGQALQYILSPWVIQLNPPESLRFLLNWFLFHHAKDKLARMKTQLTIPVEWLNSEAAEVLTPAATFRKIPLVHPEAKALSARDPRFSIQRHSAFAALNNPVDVIRSMNIFNLVYFSREHLSDGVRAVWSSLKPGGWWIVGRTHREDPPAHNVSVLEKEPGGFRLIERGGEGSEIEPLVLERGWAS